MKLYRSIFFQSLKFFSTTQLHNDNAALKLGSAKRSVYHKHILVGLPPILSTSLDFLDYRNLYNYVASMYSHHFSLELKLNLTHFIKESYRLMNDKLCLQMQ